MAKICWVSALLLKPPVVSAEIIVLQLLVLYKNEITWGWYCLFLSLYIHHIHPKMGTMKDRNGRDLTEAEEINKRWEESFCAEELHKKYLNDLDNHDGVVFHSEPDILECEVKWALGITAANKACGGDGVPAERCESAALNLLVNLENPAVATGLEKINPHPSSQEV